MMATLPSHALVVRPDAVIRVCIPRRGSEWSREWAGVDPGTYWRATVARLITNPQCPPKIVMTERPVGIVLVRKIDVGGYWLG
jgi:hypothetical protein